MVYSDVLVSKFKDKISETYNWKNVFSSRSHPLPRSDRISAVPALEPTELYRSESPEPRPSSAPPDRKLSPTPPPKTASSMEFRSSISTVSSRKIGRPASARPVKFRPATARPSSAKSQERPVERPLAAGKKINQSLVYIMKTCQCNIVTENFFSSKN